MSEPASESGPAPERYVATLRYGQLRHVGEFVCRDGGLARGDRAVIRSERGTEVGEVLVAPRPLSAAELRALPEGREVVRKVTEQDRKKLKVLDRQGRTREAAFCRERIAAHGLAMTLRKVEHLLGGDHIVFYFTADQRVDFRGLVKDLAAEFGARILMKQIGARDEARVLGDYAGCGQELCCRTFIKDFAPVTMKMAKHQMTTLDPAKITGRCGRLMCCLRYEDDHYVELKRALPRKGHKVRTRDGVGTVVGLDVLAQRVVVELAGRRRKTFPAAEVLPVARKSSGKATPPVNHLMVTAPPLWQDEPPDATAIYSLVAADVIARYLRMTGVDVLRPVVVARYPDAAQRGDQGPRRPGYRARVEQLLRDLAIEVEPLHDTDGAHHARTVADFCRRLLKIDDLYPRAFAGWQCTACRLTRRDDGADHQRCIYCSAPLERLEGTFYFFRLSRYQRKLLATIQTRPDAIRPQLKKLELEAQLKRGLQDMVVAREDFGQGLTMPDAPSFRLAGWFESLLGYISCLIDQERNERFYRYWPAHYQLTSASGLWIHGVVWQAMLLASEVELPRQLVVHGAWRCESPPAREHIAALLVAARAQAAGDSAPAVPRPPAAARSGAAGAEGEDTALRRASEPSDWASALVDTAGADALRYLLFRDLPFGLDGSLDIADLRDALVGELGRDLGRLNQRVLALVVDSFDGLVPAPEPGAEPDRRIKELLQEVYFDLTFHMERLQFSLALSKLREAWRRLTGYLDEVRPWKLAKSEEARTELSHIVYSICESTRILAVFLWPLMPRTAEAIQLGLGLAPTFDDFAAQIKWGGLPAGARVDPTIELFPGRPPSV